MVLAYCENRNVHDQAAIDAVALNASTSTKIADANLDFFIGLHEYEG